MNKIIIVCATFFFTGFYILAAPVGNGAERWNFLPEIVAEIDGKKMTRAELVENIVETKSTLASTSRDQLEALAKITLKQQVEKYVIARLMSCDGVVPSAALVIQKYQKVFSELAVADQVVYLKRVGLTRAQLLKHWRELSINPAKQFRMAFTIWLKDKILATKVTDDEIETFYRDYQDKFKQPEQVWIRAAMVTFIKKNERKVAREKAEDILALVRQGVDFKQQAEKHQVPNGALNGRFIRGVLPKKIENIVFAMKIGQISNIITMPAGFVIIKLDKKVPAGYIPLDKVKPGLRLELKRTKAAQWFRKAITQERATIKIKSYLGD